MSYELYHADPSVGVELVYVPPLSGLRYPPDGGLYKSTSVGSTPIPQTMSAMEATHCYAPYLHTAILNEPTAGWFVDEASRYIAPTPQKPASTPADTIVRAYTSSH